MAAAWWSCSAGGEGGWNRGSRGEATTHLTPCGRQRQEESCGFLPRLSRLRDRRRWPLRRGGGRGGGEALTDNGMEKRPGATRKVSGSCRTEVHEGLSRHSFSSLPLFPSLSHSLFFFSLSLCV